jgi:uncharacterized membrane protein YuzA (DUF378 family)
MKVLDRIALVLVIIGALNWGAVGLFRFDCVAAIFGGHQPRDLRTGGHLRAVVHHPAVP